MTWERIESNWLQFKADARQYWSKLSDEQIEATAGKHAQLSATIQARYGVSKEEADLQLANWERLHRHTELRAGE